MSDRYQVEKPLHAGPLRFYPILTAPEWLHTETDDDLPGPTEIIYCTHEPTAHWLAALLNDLASDNEKPEESADARCA